MKKCEKELEPIREQLEEVENHKRKLIREGERAVENILERERFITGLQRAAQRNFQLVVITHDGDFIEQLSRLDLFLSALMIFVYLSQV